MTNNFKINFTNLNYLKIIKFNISKLNVKLKKYMNHEADVSIFGQYN